MFGFIYKWVNLVNGMEYIGSHLGPINDGYTGSGKRFCRAITKYGIENFSRTILETGIFESKAELFVVEQKWLNLFNAARNPKFYNISAVAGGGDTKAGWSEERRQKFSAKIAGIWSTRSLDDIQKIVNKRRKTIEDDPEWGKRLSLKLKETYASMSPEVLKVRAQKSLLTYDSEKRSKAVKKGKEKIPFDQRRKSALLAVANTSKEAYNIRAIKIQAAKNKWTDIERLEHFAIISAARKGKLVGNKNGRAKTIMVDGLVYSTMKEAMKSLSISEPTLRKRLKSVEFTNYKYMSV